MTTAVELQSITLDDQGRPIIAGTRFKVLILVREHLGLGLSPEQLIRQHEDLTLAQTYAALAYYYEHREELDAELRRQDEEFQRFMETNPNEPILRRLREKGLLT